MTRKLEEESCPNCNLTVEFLTIKGYVMSPIICHACHAFLEINETWGVWELTLLDVVDSEREYYEKP